MQTRRLGRDGPDVSALGLGCMGMSYAYGAADDQESLRVLDRALELGVSFWDTADIYGPHANEALLGEALKGRRKQVFLATKFGIQMDPDTKMARGVNGRPDYVRAACDASLKRLGVEVIDLYYLHRVDPNTPIEDTVGAMAELVQSGKVRFLGLSEASAETLARACAVHQITALQSEYSLWTRDPETTGALDACRRLGVGLVPYSPLGRGFLSGDFRSPDDLPADDWRRSNPRFQGEAFAANLRLVDAVRAIADRKGCTPSQLALAWVLAQGDDVVPIPGTKRIKYLEENVGALDLTLTDADLAEIDRAFPADAVAGARYPETMMRTLNG